MSAALVVCLLALVAAHPAQAAFPGKNGKIAFQSNRDGVVAIYTITDGGTAKRITPSSTNTDPAYSPDGGRIAFVSGGTLGYDIFVMDADGSGRRQLTDIAGSAGSDGSADSEPAWSHDGSKIAFVSNTSALDGQSDPEIWVMNANGSDPHPITSNSYPDTQPAWSPDGSRIAFESSRRDLGDVDQNIYVMNANGSGQTNITPNVSDPNNPNNIYQGHDEDPTWSPDGTKIAYVHAGETGLAGGTPDIWTRDPNGANRAAISGTASVSETMPAWSPDGTKIAYVRATGTDRNIAVMNADGANQHAIDTSAAHDTNPDWQPNSAPTIGKVRPAAGSETRDRTPAIAATVSDRQTDLAKANMTLSLDGSAIPRKAFSYDRATDRLSYTPASKLSFGRHAVQIVARDEMGLRATKGWSFKVIR